MEIEIGNATVTSIHERAMWVSHLLAIVDIRQIERHLVNVRQLDASRGYMHAYKAFNMLLERHVQKPWNRRCWWDLSSESKDRMDMMCRRSHAQSLKQWMGGFTWS